VKTIGLVALSVLAASSGLQADDSATLVRVGSKLDIEGSILGEMVAQLVRSAGHRSEFQQLGSTGIVWQALRKGDRSELGIVFFDLKLPDKSGFELLKLLQERRAFSNTLKVVVSQIEDMEQIRKAYRLGADSFLTKPVGHQDLKELIGAFPDNWLLLDTPAKNKSAGSPANGAEPDPYSEAAQVWAKNREIIQVLRTNMERLRTQLSDNEETFAIIETLTEELRNVIGSAATQFTSRNRGI